MGSVRIWSLPTTLPPTACFAAPAQSPKARPRKQSDGDVAADDEGVREPAGRECLIRGIAAEQLLRAARTMHAFRSLALDRRLPDTRVEQRRVREHRRRLQQEAAAMKTLVAAPAMKSFCVLPVISAASVTCPPISAIPAVIHAQYQTCVRDARRCRASPGWPARAPRSGPPFLPVRAGRSAARCASRSRPRGYRLNRALPAAPWPLALQGIGPPG